LRVQRDEQLCDEIRRIWEDNCRIYGIRKDWHQMQWEGHSVARCTVARLMRRMGLKGVVRSQCIRTTVSDKTAFSTRRIMSDDSSVPIDPIPCGYRISPMSQPGRVLPMWRLSP